jgi:homoserine O-acetyltransferase
MPPEPSPPPATGAWREGDPPGQRTFLSLGAFRTQSGFLFPDLRVAYQSWGPLHPDRSNALFVAHALTGDSHACGEAGPGHRHAGWWNGLIGPGRAVDTRQWHVVCANVLGGCQGTTGPATPAPDGRPWGSRFPVITVADMVEVERRLSDALGIGRWACMLGPSLGGMRVLEWLVANPDRLASGLVIGATAAVGADQIGSHEAQIAAIRADERFRGGDYYSAPAGEGPHRGLGVARRIAHLSYRSRRELEVRFGRNPQHPEDPYAWRGGQGGGRFAIASYLDHQADKLVRRFDANSYIALTQAMSLFDLGRGRGGFEQALGGIRQPLTVVGVDSDRLFPLEQQEQIVRLAPGAGAVRVIRSLHGHDGFLVEADQLAAIVAEALGEGRAPCTKKPAA